MIINNSLSLTFIQNEKTQSLSNLKEQIRANQCNHKALLKNMVLFIHAYYKQSDELTSDEKKSCQDIIRLIEAFVPQGTEDELEEMYIIYSQLIRDIRGIEGAHWDPIVDDKIINPSIEQMKERKKELRKRLETHCQIDKELAIINPTELATDILSSNSKDLKTFSLFIYAYYYKGYAENCEAVLDKFLQYQLQSKKEYRTYMHLLQIIKYGVEGRKWQPLIKEVKPNSLIIPLIKLKKQQLQVQYYGFDGTSFLSFFDDSFQNPEKLKELCKENETFKNKFNTINTSAYLFYNFYFKKFQQRNEITGQQVLNTIDHFKKSLPQPNDRDKSPQGEYYAKELLIIKSIFEEKIRQILNNDYKNYSPFKITSGVDKTNLITEYFKEICIRAPQSLPNYKLLYKKYIETTREMAKTKLILLEEIHEMDFLLHKGMATPFYNAINQHSSWVPDLELVKGFFIKFFQSFSNDKPGYSLQNYLDKSQSIQNVISHYEEIQTHIDQLEGLESLKNMVVPLKQLCKDIKEKIAESPYKLDRFSDTHLNFYRNRAIRSKEDPEKDLQVNIILHKQIIILIDRFKKHELILNPQACLVLKEALDNYNAIEHYHFLMVQYKCKTALDNLTDSIKQLTHKFIIDLSKLADAYSFLGFTFNTPDINRESNKILEEHKNKLKEREEGQRSHDLKHLQNCIKALLKPENELEITIAIEKFFNIIKFNQERRLALDLQDFYTQFPPVLKGIIKQKIGIILTENQPSYKANQIVKRKAFIENIPSILHQAKKLDELKHEFIDNGFNELANLFSTSLFNNLLAEKINLIFKQDLSQLDDEIKALNDVGSIKKIIDSYKNFSQITSVIPSETQRLVYSFYDKLQTQASELIENNAEKILSQFCFHQASAVDSEYCYQNLYDLLAVYKSEDNNLNQLSYTLSSLDINENHVRIQNSREKINKAHSLLKEELYKKIRFILTQYTDSNESHEHLYSINQRIRTLIENKLPDPNLDSIKAQDFSFYCSEKEFPSLHQFMSQLTEHYDLNRVKEISFFNGVSWSKPNQAWDVVKTDINHLYNKLSPSLINTLYRQEAKRFYQGFIHSLIQNTLIGSYKSRISEILFCAGLLDGFIELCNEKNEYRNQHQSLLQLLIEDIVLKKPIIETEGYTLLKRELRTKKDLFNQAMDTINTTMEQENNFFLQRFINGKFEQGIKDHFFHKYFNNVIHELCKQKKLNYPLSKALFDYIVNNQLQKFETAPKADIKELAFFLTIANAIPDNFQALKTYIKKKESYNLIKKFGEDTLLLIDQFSYTASQVTQWFEIQESGSPNLCSKIKKISPFCAHNHMFSIGECLEDKQLFDVIDNNEKLIRHLTKNPEFPIKKLLIFLKNYSGEEKPLSVIKYILSLHGNFPKEQLLNDILTNDKNFQIFTQNIRLIEFFAFCQRPEPEYSLVSVVMEQIFDQSRVKALEQQLQNVLSQPYTENSFSVDQKFIWSRDYGYATIGKKTVKFPELQGLNLARTEDALNELRYFVGLKFGILHLTLLYLQEKAPKGCYLHVLPKFPDAQSLKKYENNFILVKNGQTKRTFFISRNKMHEKPINNFKLLNNIIERGKGKTKIHLKNKEIVDIFKSTPSKQTFKFDHKHKKFNEIKIIKKFLNSPYIKEYCASMQDGLKTENDQTIMDALNLNAKDSPSTCSHWKTDYSTEKAHLSFFSGFTINNVYHGNESVFFLKRELKLSEMLNLCMKVFASFENMTTRIEYCLRPFIENQCDEVLKGNLSASQAFKNILDEVNKHIQLYESDYLNCSFEELKVLKPIGNKVYREGIPGPIAIRTERWLKLSQDAIKIYNDFISALKDPNKFKSFTETFNNKELSAPIDKELISSHYVGNPLHTTLYQTNTGIAKSIAKEGNQPIPASNRNERNRLGFFSNQPVTTYEPSYQTSHQPT